MGFFLTPYAISPNKPQQHWHFDFVADQQGAIHQVFLEQKDGM
jgi:Uri superfamily endonuclease